MCEFFVLIESGFSHFEAVRTGISTHEHSPWCFILLTSAGRDISPNLEVVLLRFTKSTVDRCPVTHSRIYRMNVCIKFPLRLRIRALFLYLHKMRARLYAQHPKCSGIAAHSTFKSFRKLFNLRKHRQNLSSIQFMDGSDKPRHCSHLLVMKYLCLFANFRSVTEIFVSLFSELH